MPLGQLGSMQMLQQRMGRRRQMAPGGQQGILGRMLAARGQGRMRQAGSPIQALAQRRAGRMAGNRQLLQNRFAAQ